MIVHVSSVWKERDDRERLRLKRAHATWNGVYIRWPITYVHVKDSDTIRSARDLGDDRNCPFVKDIIRFGQERCDSPDDLIVLTNSDSCLVRDLHPQLVNMESEACYSHRRNFNKPLYFHMSAEEIKLRGEPFEGVDLVAFTSRWWTNNHEKIPDMLMGYEGWDWVFRFMIGVRTKMDLVYHENHGIPTWLRNRETLKGQLYNRSLALKWVESREDKIFIKSQWKGINTYRLLPEHR